MNRTALLLASISSLLLLLTGCEKRSRFDDKKVVNLCAVVSQAEAETILGPLLDEPKADPASPGLAGTCTWRFKSAAAGVDGRLTAMLVTEASNNWPQGIGRWFAASLPELKAEMDAHPVELKNLGDRAFLYQKFKPNTNYWAIAMQQSRTCAILRIDGASSSQLERFAAILAREAGSRDTPEAPGNQPVVTATTSAIAGADAPQRSVAGSASADSGKNDEMRVLYTMGYIEDCIRVDELLRKSCDRWRDQLSEKNRQYCDLPHDTFEARTASDYGAFKQTFSAQIQESEPKISDLLTRGRVAFEQRFAGPLAGRISGLELEALNRQLGRECTLIETEWLKGNEAK
jgi:hypothetical protein